MADLHIGKVKIDNGLLLGPMAGVTDLPFRLLCREQGVGLVCTEMVSAKAIYYNNKNTDLLLRSDVKEEPVAVQLFGSDPDIVSDMAVRIEEGPWSIIDFNMGCPVPKVVNNGEGSALMRNPELAGKIISAMAGKLKKPVTVKMRKGFAANEVNAVELAKRLEAAGAAAITVHGRTREQYYHGECDWDIIRQVKEAVQIPVIGSGDVVDVDTYLKMKDVTGCDGVMVARAALGNPWIFRELAAASEGRAVPDRPDRQQIKDMMLRHLQMEIDYDGEFAAIREMRKHIAWYTAGQKCSGRFRDEVNQIEKIGELYNKINEFFI